MCWQRIQWKNLPDIKADYITKSNQDSVVLAEGYTDQWNTDQCNKIKNPETDSQK